MLPRFLQQSARLIKVESAAVCKKSARIAITETAQKIRNHCRADKKLIIEQLIVTP